MTALARRARLYELACEAATVLAAVEDEGERELLRDVFVGQVDEELRLGELNRRPLLPLFRTVA